MNKKKVKIIIILCLFLLETLSLFLTYKSFSNKKIEQVKETNEVDKKAFSMFINDGNDNYTEYTSSNVFPEGYVINLDKSSCIDNKGQILEGILSGTATSVTVKSTTTAYCYLYFDTRKAATEEIINTAGDDLWESTLEDDGYRYVGTDPANYICFGTTDKDTCTSDTDKYMYRIIGIFEDSLGEQHLKLIKKEALNTNYTWNNDPLTSVDWDASDLYKGLNGSYFLTNATYSYMQDSNWTDKIENWNYTSANTKTYENSGINYTSTLVQNIYLHEMKRSTKTSTIGYWKIVSSKIGIMYVSDYVLSLGNESLNYTSDNNYSDLKSGWIHITNNDTNAPTQTEWSMSQYGFGGLSYSIYAINGVGQITNTGLDYYIDETNYGAVYLGVRPVFYLTPDVTISGEGTSTNPFIIG